MKKSSILLIGSILLMFGCILNIISHKKSNEKKYSTNLHADSTFAYTSILLMTENDGKIIDNHLYKIIQDSIRSFGIDSSRPILVVRYSRYSCEPCIDFLISETTQFIENNHLHQYMTIVSDYLEADANNLSGRTINLEKNRINIPIDEYDIPYIFILDQQVIKAVFLPEKAYQKYLQFYFSILLQDSIII